MNSVPPPKPVGPRMLQRSQSGVSPGYTTFGGEIVEMTDDLLPPTPSPRLTRTASAATPRPSLTLNLDPRSTPYHSNTSHFPEGPTSWVPTTNTTAATAAASGSRNCLSSPVAAQTAQSPPSQTSDEHRTALPITPRSISKIVSLSDLRQLVHRMEAPQPPSPASSSRTDENVPGNGAVMLPPVLVRRVVFGLMVCWTLRR